MGWVGDFSEEHTMKQTVDGEERDSELEKNLLLNALIALKGGDFSAHLPSQWTGLGGKIADTFNEIVDLNRSTYVSWTA